MLFNLSPFLITLDVGSGLEDESSSEQAVFNNKIAAKNIKSVFFILQN